MKSVSGTGLLADVAQRLRERLPEDWAITITRAPDADDGRDGTLTIAAPGSAPVDLPILAKTRLAPVDVGALASRTADETAGWFIATNFLSARAREEVVGSEAFAGAGDPTGNLTLTLHRPPLVIDVDGAKSDPDPERRPLRSLKGPAAARVVRAVIDTRPPFTVTEIAKVARASAPTASRVIRLLELEALITMERGRSAVVANVDWARCIRRWALDYSFFTTNRTAQFVAVRGFTSVLERLDREQWEYAVTGSFAANEYVSASPPRLLSLYVRVPRDATGGLRQVGDELGLAPVDLGGNVAVADPFDGVVFQRARTRPGLCFVAASQAAVDLLRGPGREPQDAETLIDWMERSDAWRD